MIPLKALFIIVQEGQASKMSRYASHLGAPGSTMIRAIGSLPSKVLRFLGLERSEREILLMLLSHSQHEDIFPKLCEHFSLEERNRGIAFSVPVDFHLGVKRLPEEEKKMDKDKLCQCPHLIVTIVDRNNADIVIEAANSAGARGATIIHGRGSGVEESDAFFELNIQPEKDIILIVAPPENVVAICEHIDNKLELDRPGTGILFTLPIADAAGIIALKKS